ncbi:MAG TPA: ATP-binding protein [Terrimicrobiaceae bacterium]
MTTVRLVQGAAIQSSIGSFVGTRLALIMAVFLLLGLVGVSDYVSGFSLSFSVFYLLPIILAGWRIGRSFASLIAVLSVFSLNAGDLLAGQRIQPGPLLAWNVLIQFSFYLIVIWLLMRWKGLHETLETAVQERTRDLSAEIAAREEVEGKILTISEREQRRIGCDLHDVLCQQLAATALAAKVLEERSSGAAAVEAGNVVRMIEDGMTIAREMARGLTFVLSGNDSLSLALEELATVTQEHFKVECLVRSEDAHFSLDDFRAIHLYRIAQEAVSNAVRHGKAARLVITLSQVGDRGILTVQDDGSGMPDQQTPSAGMGLRIMRHRARMLGGQLDIHEEAARGVTISCSFPIDGKLPASDDVV